MELQPFLKLQSLVVLGGKWLPFSLVGGIPMFMKEPMLVAYKQIPKLCGKEAVHIRPSSLYHFLPRAFAPIKNDRIQSFNSWPLILCL